MTVAARINLLVVVLLVITGSLLLSYTAKSEYDYARNQLIDSLSTQILGQPQLPAAIYFRDDLVLEDSLSRFTGLSSAISYIAIRNPDGEVLALREPTQFSSGEMPVLRNLRGVGSPLDTTMKLRHSDIVPENHGLLGALLFGETIYDLTLPVVSRVNPVAKNLSRRDFAEALTSAALVESLHVVSYLHVGISRTLLLSSITSSVLLALVLYLVFMSITIGLTYMATRRISSPLQRLAVLADDIASGKIDQALQVEATGEVKEVASVLSSIIGGLNVHKKQLDVDHQLLSMKVDERTAQLSKRNEETESRGAGSHGDQGSAAAPGLL